MQENVSLLESGALLVWIYEKKNIRSQLCEVALGTLLYMRLYWFGILHRHSKVAVSYTKQQHSNYV